jgi:hypothetical protein
MIPGAEFAAIAGAGHVPVATHTAEVGAIVRAWLAARVA